MAPRGNTVHVLAPWITHSMTQRGNKICKGYRGPLHYARDTVDHFNMQGILWTTSICKGYRGPLQYARDTVDHFNMQGIPWTTSICKGYCGPLQYARYTLDHFNLIHCWTSSDTSISLDPSYLLQTSPRSKNPQTSSTSHKLWLFWNSPFLDDFPKQSMILVQLMKLIHLLCLLSVPTTTGSSIIAGAYWTLQERNVEKCKLNILNELRVKNKVQVFDTTHVGNCFKVESDAALILCIIGQLRVHDIRIMLIDSSYNMIRDSECYIHWQIQIIWVACSAGSLQSLVGSLQSLAGSLPSLARSLQSLTGSFSDYPATHTVHIGLKKYF